MAPSDRFSCSKGLQAQVLFLPSLKNCLANLPAVLVSALLDANAVCLRILLNSSLADQPSQQITQKIVVELRYRDTSLAQDDTKDGIIPDKVAYLGWTGMQSTNKAVLPTTKRPFNHSRGALKSEEKHIPLIEIDSIFGRLLGLRDRQKVLLWAHLQSRMTHIDIIQ